MKIYDDCTEGKFCDTKSETMEKALIGFEKICLDGKIKDIFILARTTDQEPGPRGLPHNIKHYISVDDEYEITVFNRMTNDIIFDKLSEIVRKDTLKNKNKGEKQHVTNNT